MWEETGISCLISLTKEAEGHSRWSQIIKISRVTSEGVLTNQPQSYTVFVTAVLGSLFPCAPFFIKVSFSQSIIVIVRFLWHFRILTQSVRVVNLLFEHPYLLALFVLECLVEGKTSQGVYKNMNVGIHKIVAALDCCFNNNYMQKQY